MAVNAQGSYKLTIDLYLHVLIQTPWRDLDRMERQFSQMFPVFPLVSHGPFQFPLPLTYPAPVGRSILVRTEHATAHRTACSRSVIPCLFLFGRFSDGSLD